MTRINLVPVADLADQHLFAEWRESKMVPAALRRSMRTKSTKAILASVPKRYTLNKGHVTFFYTKMDFLYHRYIELTDELKRREYNLSETDPSQIFLDVADEFKSSGWLPDNNEIAINVERIVTRINERPQWYRYNGIIRSPAYFENKYSKLIQE